MKTFTIINKKYVYTVHHTHEKKSNYVYLYKLNQ